MQVGHYTCTCTLYTELVNNGEEEKIVITIDPLHLQDMSVD